jgi:hypothetical protein
MKVPFSLTTPMRWWVRSSSATLLRLSSLRTEMNGSVCEKSIGRRYRSVTRQSQRTVPLLIGHKGEYRRGP